MRVSNAFASTIPSRRSLVPTLVLGALLATAFATVFASTLVAQSVASEPLSFRAHTFEFNDGQAIEAQWGTSVGRSKSPISWADRICRMHS